MTIAAHGKIVVCETPDEVAEAAADMLLHTAEEAYPRGASVALSGGSTPRAMYDLLREQGSDAAQRLQGVQFFFGDERSVANDHSDSNVLLAMEGFLKPLGISEANIHTLDGGAKDLAAEARRATLDLKTTLPPHPETGVPRFDLVFLGMGEDGHTASLFPGTKALDSTEPGFVANEVPQLSTSRLTLTYPVLNAAKCIAILCTGKGKAAVLREIFERPEGQPVRFPIERLEAGEIVWMLDRAAASGLSAKALRGRHPANPKDHISKELDTP